MLTCVTDILSIDRTRAVTGFPGNLDAAGANWPRKIGYIRSGATDVNRPFICLPEDPARVLRAELRSRKGVGNASAFAQG